MVIVLVYVNVYGLGEVMGTKTGETGVTSAQIVNREMIMQCTIACMGMCYACACEYLCVCECVVSLVSVECLGAI